MDKKTYCFDLDDTLCYIKIGEKTDYMSSYPYESRIKKVNELYEQGNFIIIDTARGSETGINWLARTYSQLIGWGLKFHKLRCGIKLSADYYIDDKGLSVIDYFNDEQ
jgi:CMP-N,N'-diacetyllegionaminic acid synthase